MRKLLLTILATLLLALPLAAEDVVLERPDVTIVVCTHAEMVDYGIADPTQGDYWSRTMVSPSIDETGNIVFVEHQTILVLDSKQDEALLALKADFVALHDQATRMLNVLRANGIDPLQGGEIDPLPEVNSLAEFGLLKDWLDVWLPHGRDWYGTLVALDLVDQVFAE